MQAGVTLARRFTMLRPLDHDLPGVERWVAHDDRRDIEVVVDLLVSIAPTAVRKAAVRAAQVRDARFARVLASGRESVGAERVTYVVTELPRGVPVAGLVGDRVVPPRVAASIVGEAARALQVASAQGIHHGYVRPSILTVTGAGRVVVAGLDADGELATQAGLGRGRTERADAQELGRVLLALITGMDPDQVTVGDLPAGLTPAFANLAREVVAGTGPATLAQVSGALGPADASALRRLRAMVAHMPQVAPEEPPPTERSQPETVHVDPTTLQAAEREAAAALAAGLATAEVAHEVETSSIDLPPPPAPDGARYATPEEAARFSKRTRQAVARTRDEPLGLDTFERFNERQNAGADRSMMQAMLEWVQARAPQSDALDAAVTRAQERARRTGPLNTGPLLVGLFVTGLVIVASIAYSSLTAPFEGDPDLVQDPRPGYPAITFSPAPLPSPSASEPGSE